VANVRSRPLSSFALGAFALAALAAVAACTPEIGDKCVLSTDCSIRSDRICDTAQPGGYCTQNCQGNGCPDEAACVLYNTSVPGCGFDDRAGGTGSRVSRSFCTARCYSNDDCRTKEGYVCANPRSYPWNAFILDDVQDQLTCLVYPVDGFDGGVDAATALAPVCRPTAPDVPAIDAGKAPGAMPDAGGDGGSLDAGGDAGAGTDAGIVDAATEGG